MKPKQKNNRNRFLPVVHSVAISLLLAGCWSSKDIDKQGIGVGLALDVGRETTVEKELNKKGGGYPKKDKITFTYQFVNPQATGKSNGTGGAQQKAYLNVSETGDSILQIARELSLKQDTPPYSAHLKVIVISTDLLRTYRMEQFLDLIMRDNEIRPSCLAFVSKGVASGTLETQKQGELPAMRLMGITENQDRTAKILPPVSLAKLAGKMNSGSSFLLQNVISSNKEVKFSGAAVIKGKTKKLGGFLDESDLEGITWITGKGKGGVVKGFDKQTGQLIIYEVKTMNSKITPHVNGNKISFDVQIESEGRLSEKWVVSGNPQENKFLKTVEKIAENEVKQLVTSVTTKMQKELQADVAGFGNRLRIEHPRVWEKVKKDWDQTFRSVPITYNVKITVTDYGASITEQ